MKKLIKIHAPGHEGRPIATFRLFWKQKAEGKSLVRARAHRVKSEPSRERK